jgi:hypothetical protein
MLLRIYYSVVFKEMFNLYFHFLFYSSYSSKPIGVQSLYVSILESSSYTIDGFSFTYYYLNPNYNFSYFLTIVGTKGTYSYKGLGISLEIVCSVFFFKIVAISILLLFDALTV